MVLAGASLLRAVGGSLRAQGEDELWESRLLEQSDQRDVEKKHRDTQLDYSHDLLIFRLKKEPHSLKLR